MRMETTRAYKFIILHGVIIQKAINEEAVPPEQREHVFY
jgi:hypothetical protein